jgi:hypothetical protein
VFYLPAERGWEAAVQSMENVGFGAVKSANPYWDAEGKGKTYEDPNGWRVVLWREDWRL